MLNQSLLNNFLSLISENSPVSPRICCNVLFLSNLFLFDWKLVHSTIRCLTVNGVLYISQCGCGGRDICIPYDWVILVWPILSLDKVVSNLQFLLWLVFWFPISGFKYFKWFLYGGISFQDLCHMLLTDLLIVSPISVCGIGFSLICWSFDVVCSFVALSCHSTIARNQAKTYNFVFVCSFFYFYLYT